MRHPRKRERLSLLETRILAVLAQQPLHGYAIARELQRQDPDGPRIFPTNLYRRLYELAARGLVRSGDPRLDARGRARKDFTITPAGRTALQTETRRLEGLVAQLHPQIRTSPSTDAE